MTTCTEYPPLFTLHGLWNTGYHVYFGVLYFDFQVPKQYDAYEDSSVKGQGRSVPSHL